MTSHWHILGAGSIGLLWAAQLHKAGHQVTLITQHPAPASQQIHFTEHGHSETLAVAIVNNRDTGPIEQLLICTKTWQTRPALASITPAITDDARLVLLQNGMANHGWLAQQYPQQQLYAAISTEAALRTSAWQVSHTGHGQTDIGGLNSCDQHIRDALHCALPVHYNRDIESALWQKLVVNCCINPLTVIYDCVNGALADNDQAMQQIRQIIIECRQVADAAGFAYALSGSEERVMQVIKRTAANSSSMRQDIKLGRRTEIDAINGYIVQQAAVYGIAVPLNLQLLNQIQGMHHDNL